MVFEVQKHNEITYRGLTFWTLLFGKDGPLVRKGEAGSVSSDTNPAEARKLIEPTMNFRLKKSEETDIRQMLGLASKKEQSAASGEHIASKENADATTESGNEADAEEAIENDSDAEDDVVEGEILKIRYKFDPGVFEEDQKNYIQLVEGFRRLGERCAAIGLADLQMKQQVARALQSGDGLVSTAESNSPLIEDWEIDPREEERAN